MLNKINTNINLSNNKKYVAEGASRDYVLDYIKSLNLEQYTNDILVKKVMDCPDGALAYFLKDIEVKINTIRNAQ